jgi:predicted ArsR family transcriptional regulator
MSYPSHPGWKAAGTSQEAAHAVAGHAKTVRTRAAEYFMQNHPKAFSADDIARALNESVLTVRPRVSELHRSGVIEPAQGRVKNASGMSAHLWRAKVAL